MYLTTSNFLAMEYVLLTALHFAFPLVIDWRLRLDVDSEDPESPEAGVAVASRHRGLLGCGLNLCKKYSI